MAKNAQKSDRRSGKRARRQEETSNNVIPFAVSAKSDKRHREESTRRLIAKPLVCKGNTQPKYLDAIRGHDLTFGVGPAGTGKTYVSTKWAAIEVDQKRYQRLIIVRPIVEAGGGLGFLPGDIAEKTDPYQEPFKRVLIEHWGESHLENLMRGEDAKVVFVAPEFIRGRTFDNAVVILDEAQNMTPLQMKTFLTRIGENSKVIINGDVDQVDIKGVSGLKDAIDRLEGMEEVGIVHFTEEDIVRSKLVKAILMRYRSQDTLALKK